MPEAERVMRWAALLLALGCASHLGSVYPFGPDTYSTSSSSSQPARARSQAIATASTYCNLRGARSIPIDINLITTPRESIATIVFRCFEAEGEQHGMADT